MNENLAPLYAQALPIHNGTMHLLLTLVAIYLILTQFGLNTKNYVLRIRYFLPIYHAILAVIIFSGLLLLSALNFGISERILRMILAVVLLIALSAAGFKRLKIYARQKELFKFRKFALFQGIAEIFLILFAGLS